MTTENPRLELVIENLEMKCVPPENLAMDLTARK
jgi:hypothetical protein